MTNLVEKLRLKGLAEEDVYFAKQDVALIKALQKKRLAKVAQCGGREHKRQAESFERRFEAIRDKHRKKPRKLLRSYRALLAEIKNACKQRDH